MAYDDKELEQDQAGKEKQHLALRSGLLIYRLNISNRYMIVFMQDKVVPASSAGLRSRREKASRFALLGMLCLGDRKSGYDLKKALVATTARFWSESDGNIYPALRKLLAEGLIRQDNKGAPATARRRQLYNITAKGRLALTEWLQKPVAARLEDNEFLLKIFFGMMMPVNDALTLIEAHREHHLRLQTEFEAIQQTIKQGAANKRQKIYLQATLAYGQAVSVALVHWADTTTKALRTLKP